MTVDELKQEVEKYREALKDKRGKVIGSIETGPGMTVLDSIVAVLEAQQERIERLEAGGASARAG